MKSKKSTLMRVPFEFKMEVERIVHKRQYDSNAAFLRHEGIRVLQNADHITDFIFGKQKKKNGK